jgi:hypothetical protein
MFYKYFFSFNINMILLIVGLVVVLLLVLFLLRKRTDEVPKIIWTYWNEDTLPEFIERCINTWRDKNPDYTVNIVTNENLWTFVGTEEANSIKNWKYNNSPQRMSDLVRLSVLSKYGGIWLDASIICYESLEWARTETKPLVYSIPELSTDTDPLIESWFIVCKPGDPFVTRWNKEFRRTDEYENIDDYVKDVNVSMKGIDFPDYLLVYVCAKKVYMDLGSDSVKILNASEGPYNYHMKGGVSSLCERTHTKLIKLRKEDRAALDERLKACVFS